MRKTLSSVIGILLCSILFSFALIDIKPIQYESIITGGDTLTLTPKRVNANDDEGVSFGVDIFSNPHGKNDNDLLPGTIAPGVTGSYKFSIKNNAFIDYTYLLNLKDENLFNLPMVYRIRTAEKYLVGSQTEWLETKDITNLQITLSAFETRDFVLDWKWDDMTDSEFDEFIKHLDGDETIYYTLYFGIRIYSYGDLSYIVAVLALFVIICYYIFFGSYYQHKALVNFTRINRRKFYHKPQRKPYNDFINRRKVYKDNSQANSPLKGKHKAHEKVYWKDMYK